MDERRGLIHFSRRTGAVHDRRDPVDKRAPSLALALVLVGCAGPALPSFQAPTTPVALTAPEAPRPRVAEVLTTEPLAGTHEVDGADSQEKGDGDQGGHGSHGDHDGHSVHGGHDGHGAGDQGKPDAPGEHGGHGQHKQGPATAPPSKAQ